ncbi:hypothetical protein Clacol_008061 [Clathrus columnatus]|uniref:RNase T2-like C-terminal domain-containing protein n=1 Tax=Clathrus columnatus TaxID=1419009 RepID=A0AAV5AKZ1_9AGAM|nr:hypothetical protein Clacol_008061 [Clathrus columnatus]
MNGRHTEHATGALGISTLEPSCITAGSPPGTDAVDFFLTVRRLYQSLPTFEWLAQGGITPSSSEKFTLSQITDVLQQASGVIPALDCDGSALNQISWYFNLQGSVIDGNFIMIDAPSKGSCASSGLTYPPKPGSSSGGGSGTSSPVSGPTGAPSGVPAKSTISILTSSGTKGGVLTSGTWSVQTPATFTATTSGSGFTLKTSKGNCGVSGGQFECGSGVSSSVFGATTSGENLLLTFQGSSEFTASSVPSGTAQIAIFTGSGKSEDFNLVFDDA